jgi:Mor family transcriptional regulator
LVRYKVANLKCLEKEDAEALLCSDSLLGQTLVMCVTVPQCKELCNKVPGAAMLVSKHRKEYTKEMDDIRKTIIKEKRLPDTFTVVSQETGERLVQPLRVLVATSTVREGFSLKENSNVRNVVSYFVDQVSIVQLLGRCRYDVDNLIIAGKGTGNNWDKHPYTKKYRELYKEFLNGKNRYWFRSIQNVVKCSFDQIKRSITPEERKAAARAKNVEEFVEWLKEKYLSVEAPSTGTRRKWIVDKRIRSKIEGKEFEEMAKKYRIMKELRDHKFPKILKFIKDEVDELDVEDGKSDGTRYYRIVEKS